jgi:hypothetical protein
MIRGRALNDLGGSKNLTEFNETSNTNFFNYYRQTLGAKVQSQEVNSPDRLLRCSMTFNLKDAILVCYPGDRLGSSHSLKKE